MQKNKKFHSSVFLSLVLGGLIIFISVLSSCSLFKVDLNTGVEPLPPSELNTRILLHEFGTVFSNEVEKLADSIINTTSNKEVKMNALYWKINATALSRQVIFQTVPYASLVDTWTFCKQQSDFFGSGAGNDLFDEYQSDVVKKSKKLEEKIALLARVVATKREYNDYAKFVDEFAAAHPFRELAFSRGSILTELNKSLGIPDSVAVKTVGTMPETISDLSSRINDYSDKIPKMAKWRTEAYLYESGVDSVDINAMMDSIKLITSRISYVAEHTPELLDTVLIKLNAQLTPLILRLDERWGETLWKIGEEREALIQAFDEQRLTISETLALEREVIMADLDVLAKDLVEQSWVHLKELIVKSLFLILLILIVMLGLPFGLGYLTGKTLAKRKLDKS